MAWRSYTVMLGLALASTALAGCIENPLAMMKADTEVSAFENKALADAAAEEWKPGAVLVGIIAFELTESDEPNVVADPNVGNGLAPAWWYVYHAPMKRVETEKARGSEGGEKHEATMESMARAFKVTAEGVVTSEEDAEAMAMGFDTSMVHAAADIQVDSTAALQAAKADESFRKVAEGFNASVIEGVAHHEEVTSWFFAAMSADGFVVATVDAATGKLLTVMPLDMNMAMPTFEWGARDPEAWSAEPFTLEGEGAVGPGGFAEFPFTLSAAYHGTIEIAMEGGMPLGSLHWEIVDANGDTVADGALGSFDGEDQHVFDVEIPQGGDHTLVFHYGSWIPLTPPISSTEYWFVLDLMPGHAPHDEDKDH